MRSRTAKWSERRPRAVGRAVATGLLLSILSGCGLHYWVKADATAEEFKRDSAVCAKEASPTPDATRYGIVVEDVYRACLVARGWMRRQHTEPPPSGYFRGIE